jgi:integrative and conjugative element protein (TIGR02256 family)
MTAIYHELFNVVEVKDAGQLAIPRTKTILDAVIRTRGYTLIQLFNRVVDGSTKFEFVIVDIECHVPPKNACGIKCPERMALCVSADAKNLVEVFALRKDFPNTMHQNQGVPGDMSSLCLYFEPAIVVFRTWTPQNFLRRIHWWLEKTAAGELHPADQPVEQLFFASRYELVLPWNIDNLRVNQSQQFVVSVGVARPDHGMTFSLHGLPNKASPQKGQATPIELNLPPVVHGFVERDPATLGELADLLDGRGIDLIATIRRNLQERVDEKGATVTPDEQITILLLHIPICRFEGGEPDGVSHRAFLLLKNSLLLGEVVGALFQEKSDRQTTPKYFKDLLNDQSSNLWRAEKLFAMDVLRSNDAVTARKQSGITDEGPIGVMVGAGSLGSFILNLWGRNGWGKWTVIDHDHIKPHNLSRHIAFTQHIGVPKAKVVAELHAAVMNDASFIKEINADATDFSQKVVSDAVRVASLVVDASTTLEYPRAASANDAFARHLSVFVTPDGNAAVLMAEDAKRKIRLRTLEAEYYRALIQENWGQEHLASSAGSFWSGASCRDISVVMPYSRITGHASMLAEQIPLAIQRDDASILIWQRDSSTGAVAVHEVQPSEDRCINFGEHKLYIAFDLEQQLRDLRISAFPNETGGVLLGYYDFNMGIVVVVACLSAPSDSKSSISSFERGFNGLAIAVGEAVRRTNGIVGYIGEWHSHPSGHSAAPSQYDIVQLAHLALKMADDGLPAVQLIVGETSIEILCGLAKGSA